MPANYAHYRFGKQVLPNLPADVRQCIQRFRRMYDLGLFGPDFFFYYFPFLKTETRALGGVFHRQSGQEFFTGACKAAGSEAARAYLYGLLGHYCLDSVCHPYINQLSQIEEAKHIPLESEFERLLLVMDQVSQPHLHDMSGKAKPTRGECMTAANFLPPATGSSISRCVHTYGMCLNFLGSANREKTEKLLRRFAPQHLEHLIPMEENEEYHFQISELLELYDQAVERYPLLLEQLKQHRTTGEPLGEAFLPDFG